VHEENHKTSRDGQVLAEMNNLLGIPEVRVKEERRQPGKTAEAKGGKARQKTDRDAMPPPSSTTMARGRSAPGTP
jgi:hypothetical protein